MLNGIHSPYKCGQVIYELDELYGRDAEINNLEIYLFQGSNHVQILGERKFGKSSLIKTFISTARQKHPKDLFVYADVSQFICRTWVDFYASILQVTHEILLDEQGDKVNLLLESLRLSYRTPPPIRIDIGFTELLFKNDLDDYEVITLLRKYFKCLKLLGIKTKLFLDELGYALYHFKQDELPFSHLRDMAMSKENYDVSIVFADRREHHEIAPERVASPGLNFITQTVRVSVIDENSARKLIIEKARKANHPVDFSEEEVFFILDKAGRLPFLIQLIAEKYYLSKFNEPIVNENKILEETYSSVKGHLLENWNAALDSEKAVLRQLVEGDKLNVRNSNQVSLSLLRRGLLIEQSDGNFVPYSKLFSILIGEQPKNFTRSTNYVKSSRLTLSHHQNEISQIIQRWGAYKTVEQIEDWLLNFANDKERSLALKLLLNIRYFDLDTMRRWCRALHGRIQNILGNALDQATFVTFGGPAKSGEVIARYYSSANNIKQSRFVSNLSLTNKGRKKVYIILDDFIGSGNQMISFSRDLTSKFKEATWLYAALVGFEEGIENIRSNTELEVLTNETLSIKDKVFSLNSGIFDKEELELSKNIFESYGKRIYPEGPLGYEDGQALVVFHDSVPNNTLPVIWSSKRGWHPIFSRHGG